MTIRALALCRSFQTEPSDEGLMLETSSFKSLCGGGQFTLSAQLITPIKLNVDVAVHEVGGALCGEKRRPGLLPLAWGMEVGCRNWKILKVCVH